MPSERTREPVLTVQPDFNILAYEYPTVNELVVCSGDIDLDCPSERMYRSQAASLAGHVVTDASIQTLGQDFGI